MGINNSLNYTQKSLIILLDNGGGGGIIRSKIRRI